MSPRYIVERLDNNDFPLYGPFETEEQATAFGNLLQEDYSVKKLEDPEETRTSLAGLLKAYDKLMAAEPL